MAAVVQPVLANCFAAGTSGDPIPQGTAFTPSLGTPDGALFDTIITTGGTLNYGTIAGRPGCIVTLTSSATCAALWTGAGMILNVASQQWFRQYLYHASYPASACPLFSMTVSGTKAADVVLNSNGTLSMRYRALTGAVFVVVTMTLLLASRTDRVPFELRTTSAALVPETVMLNIGHADAG